MGTVKLFLRVYKKIAPMQISSPFIVPLFPARRIFGYDFAPAESLG